jgi:hypothetical protein
VEIYIVVFWVTTLCRVVGIVVFTLKVEAICSYEMFVSTYLTTRCQNVQNKNINSTFYMEVDNKPPVISLWNNIYFLTIADITVAQNSGVITQPGSVLVESMDIDPHALLPGRHINFLP